MIRNENELLGTLERIQQFQNQVNFLRKAETNPVNYRYSAEGFLAEIDRMNLEVREYLQSHPSETAESTSPI